MNDLLSELRSRDITLWREGDNLRFNAPTGALTPELRAKIGARKSELLETLRHESETEDGIPQTDRSAGSPLSFSQEPLWILDQIAPGLATYNIELCWRITGPLEVAAMERSLNEISRRHEILRTRIERDARGDLVQLAMPHLPRTLRVVETSASNLDELAASEAARPFDLASGPMTRAVLARFGETDHALLLAWHHIAFDGWSQSVFTREFAALYTAFSEGRPSPLAELPIQFGDYAHWQREAFARSQMQAQLAYWRGQLSGDRPPLALPIDRPRPAQQSFRGATRSRELPLDLTAQLRHLARDEGATLFMLLLASFKALLARYCGECDICIGSPIAQRSRIETEGLIGFFVNMLALRTDLVGDPTFREILHRVRATTLEAFEHQDVPFEKVVEDLNPARHLSHQPIFQIAFVLEKADTEMPKLADLTIEPVRIPGTTAKFDLTLTIVESAEKTRTQLEYSTDLFDAATIDRLLNSLDLLLRGAVAEPNTRLSRLPILDPAERAQLLTEWNPEPPAFASDDTLPRLFAKAAARFPNAVAVADEGHALTYAELDVESSKLAAHLQTLGVGREKIVALFLDRTTELIVAILAVLKAGGAYLPLDVMYPRERIAFMLGDASVTAIITQTHIAASLPAHSASVVCLDHLTLPDAKPAASGATADSLAYVIYTSGSTGQPKGCCLTHRHVARLFTATEAWFRFDERDVWTMFHSPAFDFSVWEIWGALLHGGRLVVVPFLTSRSPEAFRKLLADEKVTVLNQTPSAFRQLIHADENSADPLALRYLIFGGEALEMASLQPWFNRHGDSRPQLVNMYGITETTVHVTYRPLTARDTTAGSVIGVPIPDLSIRVLDPQMQPVPIGVAGEVYVGGAGVAQGYLHRPELTAERFITDPFKAGARLYKTGDLARWLPGRDLEYLGRIDQQVKIRGFRVELGEIQSVLASHSGVREAAVAATSDGTGGKRLVGYFVPTTEPPDADTLRAHMKTQLPDYMIPAIFVPLAKLPLTSNGKLDREALPEPSTRFTPEEKYTPPKNAVQTHLVAIWEEVLNRKSIGIRDNFFDLGGHSLLVARVISLIIERLGERLDFGEFFSGPTIENHALCLAAAATSKRQAPGTTIHPDGTQTPLFFFHGDVLGGGFFSKTLAFAIGSDRPFHAVHPHGLQGDEIPETVEAMAAERLKWIRGRQPHGPYILGGYCNGALVAYQAARLLREAGEEVAPVLMLNADGSNLRFRPLMRICAISSALRGEDEQEKRRRFLKIRDQMCNRQTLARYYASAAADLLKRPPKVQFLRLWRKARRVLRRFVPKSMRTSPEPTAAPKPRHKEAIMNVYDDVCRAHLPGYYASPIVLFWPRGQPVLGSCGPATGWEKICPQIEIVDVPGDHLSCVAESAHVTEIGEAMKKIIARVENLRVQSIPQNS